ncbi:MAG: Gfo/Idh/MocA family oxidoreductase [Chloroflexota bacterium]
MNQLYHLNPDGYRPHPPTKHDYGIGIVGCGGIVMNAHLPAYQQFGYWVVACCSRRIEAVEKAQQTYNIPLGGTDLAVVLDNPDVQIVDLAVHANQRLLLIEKIAAAGKHILSQKPLAMNVADAARMVEICQQAGVQLMVNQQARWAPAHRAIKMLLERGAIGHLYSVMHIHRGFQDEPGSWYAALENFNIVDHGIHYIDLCRYFTGQTPICVKATTATVPGQAAVSPMIYTINCEYKPEDGGVNQSDTAQSNTIQSDAVLMSTLHFNNIVSAYQTHNYAWYLDGTEGSLIASHNEVILYRADSDKRTVIEIEGSWFPEAFGGSMGEMMLALHEEREPMSSGRDHLHSIKIAYAAVESSTSGEAVTL